MQSESVIETSILSARLVTSQHDFGLLLWRIRFACLGPENDSLIESPSYQRPSILTRIYTARVERDLRRSDGALGRSFYQPFTAEYVYFGMRSWRERKYGWNPWSLQAWYSP